MKTEDKYPMIKSVKAFGKAVIVGLGGTGQKALLQIKKNFQDSCGGKVPPCVRLLVFDTDQPDAPLRDVHGNTVSFSDSEFCRLKVNLVSEAITSPYVQDWWISFSALNNTSITDGAGGIRQAGRLALFSCIEQVRNRIETAYNEMNKFGGPVEMERDGFGLLEGSSQVIVIGSLSGGTGAGTFYDISILCRKLGGADFNYMAYVMMPWVYKNQANTAYENTYAGLVELNRLAELTVEVPLRIRYDDKLEGTLSECPYHIINLVDGQCANGERITRASDLVDFIAESVYHLTGLLGAPARSVYNNIIALKLGLNETDWKGRKAIYSTIGVSVIRYPAPEIHRAISCERTADLLDILKDEIAAKAGEKKATPKSEVAQSFIDTYKLRPTQEGVIGLFVEPAAGHSATIDDDEFEGITARQEVVDIVQSQIARLRQTAEDFRQGVGVKLAKALPEKLRQLLGARETEERISAAEALRATLGGYREDLAKACQQCDTSTQEARGKMDRAENAIAAANAGVARLIGRFKSQAKAYAQAANEHLRAELEGSATRQAMEFLGSMVSSLDAFLAEQNAARSTAATLITRLQGIVAKMREDAAASIPSKRTFKKRFEYVLGVDDRQADGNPYYWYEGTPVPSLEMLRKELDGHADLAPVAALDAGPEEYAKRVYGFVTKRCHTVLERSAMDVLRLNEERAAKQGAANPTPEIMKRALGQSVLLLPIKQDEFSQNTRSIKEFLVVGVGRIQEGKNARAGAIEEDRAAIGKAFPDYEKDHVNVTHTADPYRITITRYKAIFPLHAINGIDEMRRAYNERVLPPAHIDQKDLFVLDDPFPQDDSHHVAFKLLALATMDCFGLIVHEYKPEGGSYFRPDEVLWPACLNNYDVEKKLPGKAGKFYSLLDEISEPFFADLRAAMKVALTMKAGAAGFVPIFMDEAKSRQAEFHAWVENVASGLRKEEVTLVGGDKCRAKIFNKMVTGRYYRREADFFARLLRDRATIEKKVVQEKKNLVDIILDRREGYSI